MPEAVPLPEPPSPTFEPPASEGVRLPGLRRPEPAPLPDRPAIPEAAEAPADGPALEIPQVRDPEFYPARLLDVLPRPVDEISLTYPDSAAARDVSGTVTLLLFIDELGVVVDVSILKADPPGYFEDAAVESFRNVLFQPAMKDGRAVRSRLPVEVTFEAQTGSLKQ